MPRSYMNTGLTWLKNRRGFLIATILLVITALPGIAYGGIVFALPTAESIIEEQIGLIRDSLVRNDLTKAKKHSDLLDILLLQTPAQIEARERESLVGRESNNKILDRKPTKRKTFSAAVMARAKRAIGSYYLLAEQFAKSRDLFRQAFELALKSDLKRDALAKLFFPALQGLIQLNIAENPYDDQLGNGCVPGAEVNGEVRGLLVGISDYGGTISSLAGPPNDVALIAKAMALHGVKKQNISAILTGKVTKTAALKAMKKLVSQTGCGDFVLFYFGGHQLSKNNFISGEGFSSAPKGWDTSLVFSDLDLKSGQFDRGLMWGIELAEFVTAIRNRGANIFAILDAGQSSGLGVQHFQDLAQGNKRWRTKVDMKASALSDTAQNRSLLTPVTPQAGEFAAFYAADIGEEAYEKPLGDSGKHYGLFSFSFAKALQGEEKISVAILAERIAKTIGGLGGKDAPAPVFEASSPDMIMLQPRQGAGSQTAKSEIVSAGGITIKISHPKLTRGFIPVKFSTAKTTKGPTTLKIIGRISPVSSLAVLVIDDKKIKADKEGNFSHQLTLREGQNRVTISAMDRSFGFQTRVLKLGSSDAVFDKFAKTGKRYALIIGNKNYKDEGISDLVTPHADAKDLAQLLTEKFGFLTEVENPDGSKLPLILYDATRSDINKALKRLKRRLSKDDMLLIYYAGHGKLIKDDEGRIIDAYWIPVDGEADEESEWISATRLTHVIRQIKANNVIVIADSCYSGALSRAIPDNTAFENLPAKDERRRRFLMKVGNMKSRMLMSSGGEEPVLDEGCDGHSIFSCALLKGLNEIDKKVFSAGDLFKNYIEAAVGGSVEQVPQYKELRNSGHKGGDVVFAKSE